MSNWNFMLISWDEWKMFYNLGPVLVCGLRPKFVHIHLLVQKKELDFTIYTIANLEMKRGVLLLLLPMGLEAKYAIKSLRWSICSRLCDAGCWRKIQRFRKYSLACLTLTFALNVILAISVQNRNHRCQKYKICVTGRITGFKKIISWPLIQRSKQYNTNT